MDVPLFRRVTAVLIAVLLVLGGAVSFGSHPSSGGERYVLGGETLPPDCFSDGEIVARQFEIELPNDEIELPNGEIAPGLYALPTHPTDKLVVFAHGYGHSMWSWENHITWTAAQGAIAVVMDYRGIRYLDTHKDGGEGPPDTRGWPAKKGAEDLVAAAQLFDEACTSSSGPGSAPGEGGKGKGKGHENGKGKGKGPKEGKGSAGPRPERLTIALFGVSMGANMSGLAAATPATRTDGTPLWDLWIDVEGVANTTEIYFGARAIGHNAGPDIEEETGGPIESTGPGPYEEISVVFHTDEIAAAGVPKVVMVHGLDDGLAPYNQSRELQSALKASGVPTELYSVGRRSCGSERETTATGHIGGRLEDNYVSPFAGHASEKSETHLVMVSAFDRLWDELGFPWSPTYELTQVVFDTTHPEWTINGDWEPTPECEGEPDLPGV